ncbi:hypothetical protein GCM10010836_49480 [Aminobacter aminovorans]
MWSEAWTQVGIVPPMPGSGISLNFRVKGRPSNGRGDSFQPCSFQPLFCSCSIATVVDQRYRNCSGDLKLDYAQTKPAGYGELQTKQRYCEREQERHGKRYGEVSQATDYDCF